MSRELTIVSRRIAREMIKIQKSGAPPQLLQYFMGLGMALGYCYEVATNHSIFKEKITPLEILKWAQALPDIPEQRIIMPN